MITIIITRGRKKDVGGRQRMGETWLMMVAASCLGNLFFYFIYFFIIYSWGPGGDDEACKCSAPPAPPLPADGRGTRLPAFQPGLTIKTWATVARG